MDFLLALIGLTMLFLAGDLLVKGSVAAGLRLGIPPILVGLTIVAFGTSAPELFVTVEASMQGASGIAVGNVIGSNIANILLVLGAPALLSPMGDDSSETRRNYLIMVGVTFVAVGLIHNTPLTWWQGALLLGMLAVFLLDTYRCARIAKSEGRCAPCEDDVDEADAQIEGWKIAALIVVGIVGLAIGADLAIDGARGVAQMFGISDEAIGLTLVALGTSLPELATTIMAAVRGRADMAIGNVIGSNVFNILCILGVAASLDPIYVPMETLQVNLWIMVASAIALAPFVLTRRRVGRLTGGLFVALYVLYVGLVLAPSGDADATVSASASAGV